MLDLNTDLSQLSLEELTSQVKVIKSDITRSKMLLGLVLLEIRNRFKSRTLYGQYLVDNNIMQDSGPSNRSAYLRVAKFFKDRDYDGLSWGIMRAITESRKSDLLYEYVIQTRCSLQELRRYERTAGFINKAQCKNSRTDPEIEVIINMMGKYNIRTALNIIKAIYKNISDYGLPEHNPDLDVVLKRDVFKVPEAPMSVLRSTPVEYHMVPSNDYGLLKYVDMTKYQVGEDIIIDGMHYQYLTNNAVLLIDEPKTYSEVCELVMQNHKLMTVNEALEHSHAIHKLYTGARMWVKGMGDTPVPYMALMHPFFPNGDLSGVARPLYIRYLDRKTQVRYGLIDLHTSNTDSVPPHSYRW